jgi:hypothetical protein
MQIDPLQVGAILLLLLAAAALAAAIMAASRAPGGWRSLLGGNAGPARGKVGAEELRTLLDHADELAEGLANDLDARAARLENLIRQADDRLARLERAGRGTRVGGNPVASMAAGLIEPNTSAMGDDPMTREIYRLSDDGLPPIEIAQKLSQHTGKVELILALRMG